MTVLQLSTEMQWQLQVIHPEAQSVSDEHTASNSNYMTNDKPKYYHV